MIVLFVIVSLNTQMSFYLFIMKRVFKHRYSSVPVDDLEELSLSVNSKPRYNSMLNGHVTFACHIRMSHLHVYVHELVSGDCSIFCFLSYLNKNKNKNKSLFRLLDIAPSSSSSTRIKSPRYVIITPLSTRKDNEATPPSILDTPVTTKTQFIEIKTRSKQHGTPEATRSHMKLIESQTPVPDWSHEKHRLQSMPDSEGDRTSLHVTDDELELMSKLADMKAKFTLSEYNDVIKERQEVQELFLTNPTRDQGMSFVTVCAFCMYLKVLLKSFILDLECLQVHVVYYN